MFASEQQPHLAFPTELQALSAAMFGSGTGHRRVQSQGPASQGELVAGMRVSLRAVAATPEEAEAALAVMFSGAGR